MVYFWEKEFPLLSGRPQAPPLTRLDAFLRPMPIRRMVSRRENRLDFGSILNDGGIFLAKLSQGLVGEENAWLLATLLVSKIHQLAMARQATAREAAGAALETEQLEKVVFVEPDGFAGWMEGLEADAAATVQTVRGYRVKVQYAPLTPEEKESKKRAISEVVLRAMRRMKDEEGV